MISADHLYAQFQDHAQFCRASLIVETEARSLVPMILSPGQLRLRRAIERQQRRGQPVRIIYLKSRRIQATTGTAAEFFHATAFVPGVHTVVLAHESVADQNSSPEHVEGMSMHTVSQNGKSKQSPRLSHTKPPADQAAARHEGAGQKAPSDTSGRRTASTSRKPPRKSSPLSVGRCNRVIHRLRAPPYYSRHLRRRAQAGSKIPNVAKVPTVEYSGSGSRQSGGDVGVKLPDSAVKDTGHDQESHAQARAAGASGASRID